MLATSVDETSTRPEQAALRFRAAGALDVADMRASAILFIGEMALDRALERAEFFLQ